MNLRERKEMQQLIAVSKAKGFVTLEDVSRHLPSDFLSREHIERVLAVFNELDIAVVDDEPDAEPATEQAAVAGENGEAIDAQIVADAADEEARVEVLPASADPVRRYLHDIARIPLLGRDGEVQLAREVEEGSTQVRNEAFASPLA